MTFLNQNRQKCRIYIIFDGRNDDIAAFLRYKLISMRSYVKWGSYVRHIYWTPKKISNKNYRFWIFDLKEFKFNFQSMAAEEEFKKFENFSWIFEIFFAKFCVILRHKNSRSDEFMSSSIQTGYRFIHTLQKKIFGV